MSASSSTTKKAAPKKKKKPAKRAGNKRSIASVSAVFKGEAACEKEECSRVAYYRAIDDGRVLCGLHSNKVARAALRVNPDARGRKESALFEAELFARRAAQDNLAAQREGKLILRQLVMFGGAPLERDFYTVLPNAKAPKGNAVVFGMRSLSPMLLGPVLHGQPYVPPAENLENFHQFNKVFPNEIGVDGNPTQKWDTMRLVGYLDTEPHRHKFGPSKAEHMRAVGAAKDGNANVPLYSVFFAPDGKMRRFSYVESRVFYCTFYERLAALQPDYARLVDLVCVKRANVLIAGYDARTVDPADSVDAETIATWYADPTRSFGHEMVLYTMLKLHATPDEYPWRKAAAKLGFDLPQQRLRVALTDAGHDEEGESDTKEGGGESNEEEGEDDDGADE